VCYISIHLYDSVGSRDCIERRSSFSQPGAFSVQMLKPAALRCIAALDFERRVSIKPKSHGAESFAEPRWKVVEYNTVSVSTVTTWKSWGVGKQAEAKDVCGWLNCPSPKWSEVFPLNNAKRPLHNSNTLHPAGSTKTLRRW
jgi:hypothetical protein